MKRILLLLILLIVGCSIPGQKLLGTSDQSAEIEDAAEANTKNINAKDSKVKEEKFMPELEDPLDNLLITSVELEDEHLNQMFEDMKYYENY